MALKRRSANKTLRYGKNCRLQEKISECATNRQPIHLPLNRLSDQFEKKTIMTSIAKCLVALLPFCLWSMEPTAAQYWDPYAYYWPSWNPWLMNGNNNVNNIGNNNVNTASTRNPSCPRVTTCNPSMEAYCPVLGTNDVGRCPPGTVCCPFTNSFGVAVRPGITCCVVVQGNVVNPASTGTGNPPGPGVVNPPLTGNTNNNSSTG